MENGRLCVQDAFHSADETWVQRVIAECIAPCSCFFDVGQDGLGRAVLESSPGRDGFAATLAVHESILVKPFRQHDGWTATLMTPVKHGFKPPSCGNASMVNTSEAASFALKSLPVCPRGKSRGGTSESRQEGLPVTWFADPGYILKLASCDATLVPRVDDEGNATLGQNAG